MSFSKIIGIDVSKLTLDVFVLPDNWIHQAGNDKKGITELIRLLKKEFGIKPSEVLFVFEHTGVYSYQLAVSLQEKGYAFVLLPGLEVKRSLGITRGKSDRVDAMKIAEYAQLRRHKMIPTKLPGKEIEQLRRLLSLRGKLIKQRTGFKATLSEARRAFTKRENPLYYQSQETMIRVLNQELKKLDKEMLRLVAGHPQLKVQFDLIVSIQGVGPQTALNMIALTHAFTKFPNWRAFACYAGTAPFPYQSGSSIRGKTRVSHLANKRIKALLGNIASCAIQHNPEMRLYYQRRIEEGKHKMSTQNIIRNKLLGRIFAVVNRGTPYVDTMKFAA